MKQFLVTFKARSSGEWMKYHEDNLSTIKEWLAKYGLAVVKHFVIDADEHKCGVIFTGDIKKLAACMIDPEYIHTFDEAGVIKETVESDVYGANAIRLRILSEMESSIAKVLSEESTDEEEVIIHSDGKTIAPEICYR